MKHDGDANRARLAPPLAVCLTSECGLAAAPEMEMLRLFRSLEREQLSALLVQNQILTVERADFHALEGMLLLERGLPDKAGEQFRFAKTLYDSAPGTAPALPGRHLAWYYL